MPKYSASSLRDQIDTVSEIYPYLYSYGDDSDDCNYYVNSLNTIKCTTYKMT